MTSAHFKQGIEELSSPSTIAFQVIQPVESVKKQLVTHRAGGGGGPFSRMTKFHRLEIKPSPSSRKTVKMTDLRHLEQQ